MPQRWWPIGFEPQKQPKCAQPFLLRNRLQMLAVDSSARSSTANPRYAEAAERIRRRTRLEEYLKTRNWLTTDDVGLATLPALQALRDADYTDPTFTFEDIVLHQRPSRKQPSPAERSQRDSAGGNADFRAFSLARPSPAPPLPQGPALAMLREARAGNSHRGPQYPPTTPHEVSGQASRNILSSGV